MNNTLNAIRPDRNIAVSASAGTGKTWLLVARVVRLLLSGANPDSILAITFTRKAAAEMQSRLNKFLLDMAVATPEQLDKMLHDIDLAPDETLRNNASRLYEKIIYQYRPVKATTFHAFCQSILQRFPLEANVPVGFELSESGTVLHTEAWDALFNEATRNPNDKLAQSLETLFNGCRSIYTTEKALLNFLSHNNDWLAFTLGQDDPVDHACNKLEQLLKIQKQNPADHFFTLPLRQDLKRYTELLLSNTSKDHKLGAMLDKALADNLSPLNLLDAITPVFLTDKMAPRSRKSSKEQQKRLGVDNELWFIEMHERFCPMLLNMLDYQKKLANFEFISAWYFAGQRLLEHHQRLKREQRILDFSDLEWQTCLLLQHSNNSHWIQYKLDQRINHLLIDEFQDTNPTQWQLILPLLQELAANTGEGGRSAFIVGDAKQSIYGFRRADARLLSSATRWLEQHLSSETQPLDTSWRSAQAIMDCVNLVFSAPAGKLHDFHEHKTHHADLPGHVEVLPLPEPGDIAKENHLEELRNPLHDPRPDKGESLHFAEARMIANRIQTLVENRTGINHHREVRSIRYSDIIILLKKRTHLHAYEQALKEYKIPFASSSKTTLLDYLEVADIVALLTVLITPFDNLLLAHVLRSPVFSASDDDLIRLAGCNTSSWIQALSGLAVNEPEHSPLKRAHHWLDHWQNLASVLPVHDLLDHIYCEGNVLARYDAALPDSMRLTARANLTSFMELALEIDSGRYPSLPQFINRLKEMKKTPDGNSDSPVIVSTGNDYVRIMTIHGAKGLEAPVVFLADTTSLGKDDKSWQVIVNWPTDNDQPESFIICGNKDRQDSATEHQIRLLQQKEETEDANLLYVALTRARQMLFISGNKNPDKGSTWYDMVYKAISGSVAPGKDGQLVLASGNELFGTIDSAPNVPQQTTAIDPRLSQPLALPDQGISELNPSDQDAQSFTHSDKNGVDARFRGELIHRILELLSRPGSVQKPVRSNVASEFHVSEDNETLVSCWNEAIALTGMKKFSHLFNEQQFDFARNEVPVCYRSNSNTVYGIIDRLVMKDDEVVIVDYKTHRHATKENIVTLAESYKKQLGCYADGIKKIWPEKRVSAVLLFTACAESITVAV